MDVANKSKRKTYRAYTGILFLFSNKYEIQKSSKNLNLFSYIMVKDMYADWQRYARGIRP